MKTIVLFFIFIINWSSFFAQEQRHSFAPYESVIYNNVALNIVANQEWSTDRLALPGYFSVYDTALYINYSDNYNINGHVKHYVRQPNQGFTFPVGTGSDLRTLQTSGTIPNNSEFATAWILGDPSGNMDLTSPNAGTHSVLMFATPLTKISTIGQWDWQDLSNTSAGVTITVSIPDMTAFSTAANLRLAGWDGTQWIDLSGGPTATGNVENSLLTGTMQNGITAIAIGTILDITLPVKIKSFNATAQLCNALVTWVTENESVMKQYELQQSLNGSNFTTIYTVLSNQMSASNTYKQLAIQTQGQAYYRVKLVEQTGAFSYTEIIGLRTSCNDKNYMVAYPNPVTSSNGVVTINFRNYNGGKGNIVLYNNNGKLIYKTPIDINGTSNIVKINMANLPQSSYFISIMDNNSKPIGNALQIVKLQ